MPCGAIVAVNPMPVAEAGGTPVVHAPPVVYWGVTPPAALCAGGSWSEPATNAPALLRSSLRFTDAFAPVLFWYGTIHFRRSPGFAVPVATPFGASAEAAAVPLEALLPVV